MVPGLGRMKEDLIIENILQHNQYAIDLTKLLLIQDAPELAITEIRDNRQDSHRENDREGQDRENDHRRK